MPKVNNRVPTRRSPGAVFVRLVLLVMAFGLALLAGFMYGENTLSSELDLLSTRPFQEMQTMRYVILILGLLLATLLMFFRMILGAQEKKVNKRIRLLLDATPLSCVLWDRNHNVIDCNEEAMRLYGMANREEFESRLKAWCAENEY